jgi:hypothetical protein
MSKSYLNNQRRKNLRKNSKKIKIISKIITMITNIKKFINLINNKDNKVDQITTLIRIKASIKIINFSQKENSIMIIEKDLHKEGDFSREETFNRKETFRIRINSKTKEDFRVKRISENNNFIINIFNFINFLIFL